MSFIAWLNQNYEERGPIKWLAFLFELIAAVTLFALMVLTCADVIGRYFLNNPVVGAAELTEISLAIILFSVMPVITWRGGHIVVDLLDSVLPGAVIRVLGFVSTILIAVSLYFVAVRIYELGARDLRRGITTDFLYIPTGLVIQYIALFSFITALLLIVCTFLKPRKKENKNQAGAQQ